MKQVLQSLRNGATQVAEIPCPAVQPGALLIRTRRTLISPGTERMLVDFGKANYVQKARQQPDRVKQVLQKMRTDGVQPTLEAVFNKLDQPLPLGYCNVGEVLELGPNVQGFAIGDRVVSNGHHAEAVNVPKNLSARIPDNVSDEDASFTVLGAIALQGIRLAAPTLGETFAVMGLGLVGLLTVQLLRANGCRVIGLDFDAAKLELARSYGAETVDLSSGSDPVTAAMDYARGRGVDGVLITAATRSNEPVHQAAQMSRKRGRIVLVGVAGLELSRADFFEKELTFQVSCSYGPGRYDSSYETKGQDYPVGFVRWTEQRNFEAVLDMLAAGRLDVSALISHRFAIEDAEKAYGLLSANTKQPTLGIILTYKDTKDYPNADLRQQNVALKSSTSHAPQSDVKMGFIGAGNYASAVLIPAFAAAGASLNTIISNGGVSGAVAGRKHGFVKTSTNVDDVLGNKEINAVAIATRHDSHADLALKALEAGKHVFVEKPLAISASQLDAIAAHHAKLAPGRPEPLLMVGFNRRFAPQTKKIAQLLSTSSAPKSMIMTVNAGMIPSGHWTQQDDSGGGRLIGEGCHFIDLLRHLAGAKITTHTIAYLDSADRDTFTVNLGFANGSIGAIHYFSNGTKDFPKERLEVFSEGRILQLDNFRKLRGYGWKGFRSLNLNRQDKGQKACAAAFISAIKNGAPAPIAFDELIEVSRITLALAKAQA